MQTNRKKLTFSNFPQGTFIVNGQVINKMMSDGTRSSFFAPSNMSTNATYPYTKSNEESLVKWMIKGGDNFSDTVYLLTNGGEFFVGEQGLSINGTASYTFTRHDVVEGVGNLSSQGGAGMWWYSGYIIIASKTRLFCVDPTSLATYTGFNDQFSTVGVEHNGVFASDNRIYFCSGRFVDALRTTIGQTFNPSDPATYSFTPQVLDLPNDVSGNCIAQLQNYIVIGTENNGNTANCKIYAWDRIEQSFIRPIEISGSGISQMIVKNNNLIVFTKDNHQAYQTNLSFASPIVNFAEILRTNFEDIYINGDGNYTPDGYGISASPQAVGVHNDKILTAFGLRNLFTDGLRSFYPFGVWSFNTDSTPVCEQTVSALAGQAEFCDEGCLDFGAILTIDRFNYAVSYASSLFGGTLGVMIVNSFPEYGKYYQPTDAGFCYFETDNIIMADNDSPYTFQRIDLKTFDGLHGGQVTVSYRENRRSEWIICAEFNSNTMGDKYYHSLPFSGTVRTVEFRVDVVCSPAESVDGVIRDAPLIKEITIT